VSCIGESNIRLISYSMRTTKDKLDTAISTVLRMISRCFGLLQDKARLICLRFPAVNIALAPYIWATQSISIGRSANQCDHAYWWFLPAHVQSPGKEQTSVCRLVVVRDGRVLFLGPNDTSRTIHALEVLYRLACPILLVELAELVSEFVSDTQTKNGAGKPNIQVIHLFLHLLENVGILDDDLRESVVLGAKRLVLCFELRLLGAGSLVS